MEVGDFVVKFHVHSRSNGFSWALLAVYGATPFRRRKFLRSYLILSVIKRWGSPPSSIRDVWGSLRVIFHV